jgi:hypothetical protein
LNILPPTFKPFPSITSVSSDVQSASAPLPRVSKDEGGSKVFNPVQPEKAPDPIDFKPSGNVTDVMNVLSLKTETPIPVTAIV